MKTRQYNLSTMLLGGLVTLALNGLLCSCNSNDDAAEISGGIIIPDDDDEECCNEGEELRTRIFLNALTELPELSSVINEKYTLKAYSANGHLYTGFNKLYFAVEKSNEKHVKDFSVGNLAPLMTMGSMMGMQHSTPTTSKLDKVELVQVYEGWIAFLMPSDAEHQNTWELSFDYAVKGEEGHVENRDIVVEPQQAGWSDLKAFTYADNTFYLVLDKSSQLATGRNDIKAYIAKQTADKKQPYTEAAELFTIDIDPRMPDMGNHTSPGNEPLTLQEDGSYLGTINLTMTGLWRIHLTVHDAEGNIVAGGDDQNDGYSSLYWDVTI